MSPKHCFLPLPPFLRATGRNVAMHYGSAAPYWQATIQNKHTNYCRNLYGSTFPVDKLNPPSCRKKRLCYPPQHQTPLLPSEIHLLSASQSKGWSNDPPIFTLLCMFLFICLFPFIYCFYSFFLHHPFVIIIYLFMYLFVCPCHYWIVSHTHTHTPNLV